MLNSMTTGTTMNAPKTDFVLVRTPRTETTDSDVNVEVMIIRNNGKFDFSNYSYLRMQTTSMEEWVPTTELVLYKKVFGILE